MATKKTCDKSFCKDYMLLIPKHVRLWDLIMPCSPKTLEIRPNGTVEESFSRCFIIFISIVAQKLLQVVNKPLGWAGSAIEFLPNFLDANGGFLKLLFNFISGFAFSHFCFFFIIVFSFRLVLIF
ncbi:Lipase, class 3 [Artemisia annua]|uniref:Lipase, class 3 n=1 Tax=Artemisia annua TaxID=35608 RepID=A0A2U1NZ59_ARTAN|nr:Lipase, class 3 [Artemisia annua]